MSGQSCREWNGRDCYDPRRQARYRSRKTGLHCRKAYTRKLPAEVSVWLRAKCRVTLLFQRPRFHCCDQSRSSWAPNNTMDRSVADLTRNFLAADDAATRDETAFSANILFAQAGGCSVLTTQGNDDSISRRSTNFYGNKDANTHRNFQRGE